MKKAKFLERFTFVVMILALVALVVFTAMYGGLLV